MADDKLPYMEFKLKEVLISGVSFKNGDGDDAIPDGTSNTDAFVFDQLADEGPEERSDEGPEETVAFYYGKMSGETFDDLAVDPNNPNTEVDGRDFLYWQRGNATPGPDDNVGVPAVQTDDGLLLPAVQDDGLLLPAVRTDDGLLLPY